MSLLARLRGAGRARAGAPAATAASLSSAAAEAARGADRLGPDTLARLAEAEAFHREIAPWLIARAEDSVLIVPPNRVYKLGGSAYPLLDWLARGGRLAAVPGLDESRAAEVLAFFAELRAAYEGKAVELGRVPFDLSFTSLPVLGELALTYRCNEACRFCYAGCGEDPAAPAGAACAAAAGAPTGAAAAAAFSSDRELSAEEARRIIRAFKEEAKIPFFSFTGGEPLLREDLEELARYAISLGLRVNLITNGSLATPKRAASLKAAGFDTAQVSLESPDEAVHDALCQRPGAFRRTVAGIAALRGAGISVQTNTTLTRANAEGLLRLPAFLGGLGVRRFSANLFIPTGRGAANADLALGYAEVGPLVDALRAAALREGLTFFWYSPTPYCLYNPVARGLGNKSCAACDGLVHVNPRGEILPCSSWAEPVGSVLEEGFAAAWGSARAREIKAKAAAPAACKACPAFLACQGACPLYWAAFGEAEIEDPRRERLGNAMGGAR